LRRQWGAGPDSLVMLVVGRLAAEKNLDVALQAHAAMQAHHADVKLVFVGDGPLRESLQQRCPQAEFAGMRRHEELAGYYASADLFVFPSLTETFGNVTIEALASGLPVLAFDTAAAGDWVVSQSNGWLVPAGEVAAFVRVAVSLAQSPSLLVQARDQARARVAHLDWQQIAMQVEALMLQATGAASTVNAVPRRALAQRSAPLV
jgi:glycosyltransferase involved in cell wall biosynthesis